MRVVLVELKMLPPTVLTDRHLVVLTVVDSVRHAQLFRIDKPGDRILTEGIAISIYIYNIYIYMSVYLSF